MNVNPLHIGVLALLKYGTICFRFQNLARVLIMVSNWKYVFFQIYFYIFINKYIYYIFIYILKTEPELEPIKEEVFPDEAYLMVSQLQWEDDVVWDGNEIKQKV